jgi:hypothetical protein
MRLILNEQEVTDGICVYIADEVGGGYPEYVEVKEIGYTRNDEFYSKAVYFGKQKYELDTYQICEGIQRFLVQYHSFNRQFMSVNLKFEEGKGIWAEVLVNEK